MLDTDLWNIVGEVAHVAPPSVAMVKEGHKGIDVCPRQVSSRGFNGIQWAACLHRRHLLMTWSSMTGTGASSSCSDV